MLELPSPNNENKSLSLEELQNLIFDSFIKLEASLFQHASYESDRVRTLKRIISDVEKELFNPETLKSMDDNTKRQVYFIASNNLSRSMEFMMEMHNSVKDSIDIIGKMKTSSEENKLESKKSNTIEVVDFQEAEKVKQQIMNAIKDKISPDRVKKES